MSAYHRIVVACAALALGAAGCSALEKAKKTAAKSMGVKTTTKSVKTADLGPDYQSFVDSEYDVLSAKAASGTKKDVKYKHFGVKSLDTYLKDANTLYASYVIANALVDKTLADMNQFVEVDVLAVADEKAMEKEITKAIKKKTAEELSVVERFNANKANVELMGKNLVSIGERAVSVTQTGQTMATSVTSEFQADPKKALVLDEALSEVKLSLERLGEIATGTPELVKKCARLGQTMDSVARLATGAVPASGGTAKPATATSGGATQPAAAPAGTAPKTEPAAATSNTKTSKPKPPPPATKKAGR